MTTFQNASSFGKLATFLAIALLSSAAARAAPADHSAVVPSAIPKCDDSDPQQDTTNGYVLLLFFGNDDKGRRAAAKTFHFPGKKPARDAHPTGCIWDPDDPQHTGKGIRVMGACPTDCASKSRDVAAAKTGDPLGRLDGKRWAIFFADPAATRNKSGHEALNDDGQTTFRMYQIRAKNSCHAGRILNSLYLTGGYEGYLGQIMIGYANARAPNPNPIAETSCAPWTPPPGP